MGIACRNRWMAGAAALALASVPAAAQVRQPPADAAGATTAPTGTPIKINPRDVINAVDGLLNPKPKPTPSPTPTPTLSPTGQPTATPTPTPTKTPDPRPTATATSAPKPTPTATPTARPTAAAVAEPPPEGLSSEPAEPLPSVEPAAASAAPELSVAPLPETEHGNYLGWIAALVALLAGGGYVLKQWLRPKLTVSCEIETGASTLTAATTPAFTAPDLAFTIRIEPGEASAPTGNPVLASGDTA